MSTINNLAKLFKTSTWYHRTNYDLPEEMVVESKPRTVHKELMNQGLYVSLNMNLYEDRDYKNIYEVESDEEPEENFGLDSEEFVFLPGAKVRLKIINSKIANDDIFQDRLGRCYELAGRYVINSSEGVSLVHGSIENYGNPRIKHAWVKFSNGAIYDAILDITFPSGAYEDFANTVEDNVYLKDEAVKLMLSTGNFGPWS